MQVVRVVPAGRPDTYFIQRYNMENGMREELETVAHSRDSVFYSSFVQARARVL